MTDIDALIAGFQSFHEEYINDEDGRYSELARYGAHSQILMIACCDSRVDPAIITNCSAGDLMVIRNMGNLVPPYDHESRFAETQAALEFALCYLKVEHIIVMGHSRCGGIRSLLTRLVDDFDPERALDRWTRIAEPAAREVLEEMPEADLDDPGLRMQPQSACHFSAEPALLSMDRGRAGKAQRADPRLVFQSFQWRAGTLHAGHRAF